MDSNSEDREVAAGDPLAATDNTTAPAPEEPSPFEKLLDDFDALKERVAQLEQLVVGHGHAFDEKSISQIATHVFKRINDAIRVRGSKSVQ